MGDIDILSHFICDVEIHLVDCSVSKYSWSRLWLLSIILFYMHGEQQRVEAAVVSNIGVERVKYHYF